MECNKEEAFRAMQLAEKKMQAHDFSGAQRIAQKAQRLFPDLENISQLLTVCEVHCSAQVKIGGTEMDWYGILQTEHTVDAVTIKKQYRKLALLLHPDKNKFAGAEAAFKLIGEANRVLSDQANRSGYDMRYRALVKTASSKPSLHKPKGNSFAQKRKGAANNFQNHPCPQSTGWYWHQQAQSQTFWTCCSSCNTRYQYYRDCVNKTLVCQSCYKSFVALDWGISGPGSFWGQFTHAQETPNQGPPNVASQGSNGKSSVERSSNTFGGSQPMSKTGSESKMEETPNRGPPNVASQGSNGMSSVERSSNTFGGSQPMSKTGSESKMEERDNGDVPVPKQGVGMPDHDSIKSKKPDSSKKLNRKRGRKLTVESSGSYMTESDDVREDNVADSSAANEGHPRRRSSRQKQNVSYKDNFSDDDDFVSPPKRSWVSNSSDVSKESTRKASVKGGIANDDLPAQAEFSSVPLEESSSIKRNRACKSEVKGKEADIFDQPNQKSKTDDDSELTSNEAAVPESFSSPDPEFNDFDKEKAESCFAVNQTWAIYDQVDCMPRFYARIKKVFSPEFKLKITWLEVNPDNEVESDWCDKELPVACGKYVLGDTQMADHNMFSHQMHCIKGRRRNTFVVYPRKGETWALFQNWGINWSTDPQKHQPFKFDFVEVLSDFVEDAGVHVAYLGRLKGFVSVFQQTEQHGILSFQIPPNEMYRFSHRVPSFRMSGEEREGIPKGSYELDPASLPPSLFESGDHNDAKMDGRSINAGINVSCPKSQKSEAEDASGFEGISASGKHERSSLKKETSLPRKSPRKSNSNGQTGGSQGVAVDSGKNDLRNGNVPLSKRRASVCQADEEGINTPQKQGRYHESEAFKLRRSPRDVSKQKTEANGNRLTNEEVSSRQTHSQKVENSDFSRHTTTSSSAAKTSSSVKDPSTKISAKSPAVEPSITPNCNVPQAECFDFTKQRSKEKFKVGQIWALRTDEDAKRLAYALVKRIQSTPELRVHVGLLDPSSPPKDASHPVCCGVFIVRNKETKVFSLSSFSHCLNAKPLGLNVYEIYPRKGEIWALHKSRNGDLTCPSPNKGECDIVEVLEDNDQSTTVVVLFRVSGFKSMFKAPRIQRSKTGVLDIPRAEVARFLHQIPAFQHTRESDSRLDGCWELDPSSIPVSIVCLD